MNSLPTAAVADACIRLALPLAAAPVGLKPVTPGHLICGPVRAVRHFGSVDVFLEAIDGSSPDEILVIDNGGRLDEGCIGDLVVIEALHARLQGVVVWGAHRDTSVLRQLGLPVFSYGTTSNGPLSLRQREAAASIRFGAVEVTTGDFAAADDDGAVFVRARDWAAVHAAAESIVQIERQQAARVERGESLRQQFAFADYLKRRASDPAYTFRVHLRARGHEVEE